jgi:stage III sporulation protein AD
MSGWIRAAGAVLLGLFLLLMLPERDKPMHTVLSMAICALALLSLGEYLRPVLGFLGELEALGNLQPELTGILFKATGVGMVAEISALLCEDAGKGSLGKTLRLLSAGGILWLALPVFRGLLELLQSILEGI